MRELSKRQRFLLLAVLSGIAVSFQTAISWQTFSRWVALTDPAGALLQGTWPVIFPSSDPDTVPVPLFWLLRCGRARRGPESVAVAHCPDHF